MFRIFKEEELYFFVIGFMLWGFIIFLGGYLIANIDTVYTVRFIFGAFFIVVVSPSLFFLYRQVKLISEELREKEKDAAKNSAKVSRRIWGRFYKKVLHNSLALFSAISVFLGAVLLVEQNRLLSQSNKSQIENFKKSQTVNMLMQGSSEILIKSKKNIFYYVDEEMVIPAKPPEDEEEALRQVLNYYERISAQANSNALDFELIRNTVGGPMKRHFEVSKKYIQHRRCKSNKKSIRHDRRKIYEQFEKFVSCSLEKQIIDRKKLSQCFSDVGTKVFPIPRC